MDGCHHGKEEDVLFVAMAEAGFPTESGPLAVMRQEHDHGRRLVRQLRELAERPSRWTTEDRERFAGVAHTFAELLRLHIAKEDDVLYPMAEARLSAAQLRQVQQLFEIFEQQRTGPGEHERFHSLAEKLAAKYPAAPQAARPSGERAPSCCGL